MRGWAILSVTLLTVVVACAGSPSTGSEGSPVIAVTAIASSAPPSPTPTAPPPPTPTARPTQTSSGPTWRQIATPTNGFDQTNSQWIEVDAPNGKKLRAVVLRPTTQAPPSPVVLMLHTAGGFEPGSYYRRYANDLAGAGFLVVVGCWFRGWYDPPLYSTDAVAKARTLVSCPDAPAYDGWNPTSASYAKALMDAARTLPGADPRRLVLTGGSAGASVSVLLASSGADVQAVVADSADYTRAGKTLVARVSPAVGPDDAVGLVPSTLLVSVADRLFAPILMVHGKADPDTTFQEALDYEAALKRLGKTVETVYVDGAGHVVLGGAPQPYHAEVTGKIIAFLRRVLG